MYESIEMYVQIYEMLGLIAITYSVHITREYITNVVRNKSHGCKIHRFKKKTQPFSVNRVAAKTFSHALDEQDIANINKEKKEYNS